jgi:hypothetical protein
MMKKLKYFDTAFMKFRVLLLGIILSSVCLGQSERIENGWKGIKVLQTTRAEVEKILGKPTIDEYNNIKYYIDEGLIRISYSQEPCSNDSQGRYDVPKDTVFDYEVIITREMDLTNLIWKKELYKKTKDSHVLYNSYYSNQNEGITISTKTKKDGENVWSIRFYVSPELYEKHRCKKTPNC